MTDRKAKHIGMTAVGPITLPHSDMFAPEALDPELARCLVNTPMPALKHPLVYSVPYSPVMNKMLNQSFKAKKAAVPEALAEGDFSKAIFLYERPYRFDAFAAYRDLMTDEDYWALLGSIYVDSENLGQVTILNQLLGSKRSCRERIMDAGERAALASLPDEVEVWKGVHQGYAWDSDWSWTTSKQVAEWFARRFNEPEQRLLYGTVKKPKVVAYFTRRSEWEILARPKDVKVLENHNL